MEAWLLAQSAEIEAIKAEIQAMIALNQHRISRDETIAYIEDHFQQKADELRRVAIFIMENR